jgi:hypothetical protein
MIVPVSGSVPQRNDCERQAMFVSLKVKIKSAGMAAVASVQTHCGRGNESRNRRGKAVKGLN